MHDERQEPGALVLRAQRGDATAREDLARAWLPVAYGAALAVLGRAADAEDATQEGFLRAFRALGTLRDPDRFGPWLLAVVRNAARDQQRARRPEPRADTFGPDTTPVPGTPNGADSTDPGFGWRRLPEDERLVAWLKASEGMTFREIADLLGTSKSAVDRTWRRALLRLRKEASRC